MIGKEIADLISPIVMWVAIVGGAIGALSLVRYWIRRGAKKEAKGEAVADAVEDRQNASEDLLKTRRRMRAAALRGWLRNRTGRGDPTP